MALEEELRVGNATAEGTEIEHRLNRRVGNSVHLFLSVLAILVLVAAGIALVVMVYRGLPSLWRTDDIYRTFHQVLQNMLLIAIAAELALLLLFHRPSPDFSQSSQSRGSRSSGARFSVVAASGGKQKDDLRSSGRQKRGE